MQDNSLPLVETLAIADIYVTGMAHIDDLGGGLYRFTWYVLQRSAFTGQMERAVVAKFVCSGEAALTAINSATKTIRRTANSNEAKPPDMMMQ